VQNLKCYFANGLAVLFSAVALPVLYQLPFNKFSSLRSKRFRGVWEQRTGFLVFCPREKWGEREREREPKMKYGGGGREGKKRLPTNPWILKTSVRQRTELVIGWASRKLLTSVDQRS